MYKKYQISLIFILLSITLFGQSSLVGDVFDEKGEALISADIVLKNTTLGTASDENGTFTILNIPYGNYNAEITSLGYQTKVIPVIFKDSKPVRLKVVLKTANESLDEVVVQGKTNEQRKREEPIKVDVISLEKILEKSTSIPEIINQTSGVKVRQSSGIGSNTTININGLQGNAVRFFKDGIPADYLGRAFSIGLVPTSIIKNIEIYKGVLPVELGADALGGAINIVTKDRDKQYLDLSYEAGSFNTHILNLSANYVIPDTKVHVGLNSYYTGSDNDYEFDFVENNGGIERTIKAKRFHDAIFASFIEANAGIHKTKFADLLDIKVAYFKLGNEVQNGINIDHPFGEVTEAEINRIISLQYKKAILPNWDVNLFAAYSNIDSEEQDLGTNIYDWTGAFQLDFRGDPITTPGGEFQKRDQRIEEEGKVARFSTKYDINDFVNLKLSSTYNRFERVGSDPFADVNLVTGIQPITIPSTYIKIVSGFGVGVSLLNKKLISETFVKNYYLETESASLNFSQSLTEKLFDRSFRWGQSFKYAFDQDTFVRVSYEDAIRIPDAEEFFGDNLFILPNPALRPESSDNLNIGFSTNINSSKTIFAEVNAFYRNTKDFIQRFPLGLINSINRNSDSQEVKGIEGNIKLNLGGNTSIRGALTFQDLRIKESIQNPNLEGSRSPNIPYYFTNLSINKEFKKPFGWSADFNIYGNYLYTEQYFVRSVNKVLEPSLFGESPSAIRSFVIPTQHQVNLGFTYKFHNIPFSINVEGINMLNEELYDDFRIPRPLRNYRLKLTYRL